jgi:hypothetical protein
VFDKILNLWRTFCSTQITQALIALATVKHVKRVRLDQLEFMRFAVVNRDIFCP